MMRRAGILIMACLLAAPAFASRKSLMMRHRGGGGGGVPENYGNEAWSWLDFRDGGTLYADAAATTIATSDVRAVRDKVHGRIWKAQGSSSTTPATIVDGGLIGTILSSGAHSFQLTAPEAIWGGDGSVATVSNFCMMVVARCDTAALRTYQFIFNNSSSQSSGLGQTYMTATAMNCYLQGYSIGSVPGVTPASLADGKYHMICVSWENGPQQGAGTGRIYVDGRLAGEGVHGVFANPAPATLTPTISRSNNSFLGGPCAEVLVYDRLPENFAEIMQILKRKYGIQ